MIVSHVKNDAILSAMRHLPANSGAAASEKGPQPAEERGGGSRYLEEGKTCTLR